MKLSGWTGIPCTLQLPVISWKITNLSSPSIPNSSSIAYKWSFQEHLSSNTKISPEGSASFLFKIDFFTISRAGHQEVAAFKSKIKIY